MFTNEIRPYESDTDHREKPCDSLGVARRRVLKVYRTITSKHKKSDYVFNRNRFLV